MSRPSLARMIRPSLAIMSAVLLAAVWLSAGAAAPARAASPESEMRAAVMALRGLIDREGAAHYFEYPRPSTVRPGYLTVGWWPADPWSGAALHPGTSRGHYQYSVTANRRRYRLVGFLGGGRTFVVSGGMPESIMLAYDHRGEEGINLIRGYVEEYAARHDGTYPLPSQVRGDGAVGNEPRHRYWPSNPWDHDDMAQRKDRGSFSYHVSVDRRSYTLRLHRALKRDYVLPGTTLKSPWQKLLTSLEDEILRRSARILAGYVGQWALQHAGALPPTASFVPEGAVGEAHDDWPQDPIGGAMLRPGSQPGSYAYAPGVAGAFTLTVHLQSGDYEAGGTVPSAHDRR